MPQLSEAKFLHDLTEVPGGWSLATVIDAFLDLAGYQTCVPALRARKALSRRLVELWASQPAEAEAWLERFGELKTATRQERLCEALLQHGAVECGKYYDWWRFTEAGLLRELRPAAARERLAALYMRCSPVRDHCRELAERLVAVESSETARKRQKLEEETSERQRLEAELQSSQQESRELGSRLAAAEAEVSSKEAEFQAVQSESAGLKEQCEEFAARAAAAESAVLDMLKELGQLQEEHGRCQQRCEELVARLEAAEAEAHAKIDEKKSDASEKQVEVQQPNEESRSSSRCQHAEAQPASAEVAKSKMEAVLQERCEQLLQQLTKAEADRSAMLGQIQVLWEGKATYKEHCRQLEKQLREAKKPEQASHQFNSQHVRHSISASRAASSEQEPNLAELFGYSFVDAADEDRASILSGSSQSSVNQNCFMLDSMFKVRLDVIREGRDLRKGSQVVAADGKTVLEVVEIKEVQATEVVDLHVGTDTLRVTPDHRVQVPDESGEVQGRRVYMEAGKLKQGDLVMIAPGKPVALTGAETHPMECKVLKIVFKPDLPVPVFSGPAGILSKGHEKKTRGGRRGGMCQRGKEAADPADGASDPTEGASIPDTAAGEYMD